MLSKRNNSSARLFTFAKTLNKMNKTIILFIILATALSAPAQIPDGAQCLIDSYPEFGIQYVENKLIFKDGSAIIYNDGLDKDFDKKLDNSDPEDMFSLKYDTSATPSYLADAGRSRCEELFKKMYGNSAAEVAKKLVPVKWFGQTIKFTSVNGANKQLELVAAEIAQHPELIKHVTGAQTFYWRQVRGANRLSAHSYGIAVDINVANSNYWLWDNPKAKETDHIGYKNRINMEVVRIFRRHGFIWGGNWYHYDTMHFEYRPEILGKK